MDTLLTAHQISETIAQQAVTEAFNTNPTTVYGILVGILIVQVAALAILYVKVVLPIIEKQSLVIQNNTAAFVMFNQLIISKTTIYEKTVELHTKIDMMIKKMDDREMEERVRRNV